MKLNEMNVFFCLVLSIRPGEDDKMNEMTLPSRHRIRNSNHGGLRLSSPLLGHGGSPQDWVYMVLTFHR